MRAAAARMRVERERYTEGGGVPGRLSSGTYNSTIGRGHRASRDGTRRGDPREGVGRSFRSVQLEGRGLGGDTAQREQRGAGGGSDIIPNNILVIL